HKPNTKSKYVDNLLLRRSASQSTRKYQSTRKSRKNVKSLFSVVLRRYSVELRNTMLIHVVKSLRTTTVTRRSMPARTSVLRSVSVRKLRDISQNVNHHHHTAAHPHPSTVLQSVNPHLHHTAAHLVLV